MQDTCHTGQASSTLPPLLVPTVPAWAADLVTWILETGEARAWQCAVGALLNQWEVDPRRPYTVAPDPETGELTVTGFPEELPGPPACAAAIRQGRVDFKSDGRFQVVEDTGSGFFHAIGPYKPVERGYRLVARFKVNQVTGLWEEAHGRG
jgi:hypothetical protein